LETSVGSSSEANLPVNTKPAERKMNTVDPLDEIAENFDCISGSEENLDSISNYSEEDFTARYGSVSCGSEDEWMSGLELYDDEPTIFSSEPNHNYINHYQVYAILKETPEELDPDDNPPHQPAKSQEGLQVCSRRRNQSYHRC
jgi:hypothetical protein